MKIKFPAWLIGGIFGAVYFAGTFFYEYAFMCDFKWESMCGLFTGLANLPAALILPYFVPYLHLGFIPDWVYFPIFNFIIGALVFECVWKFWKWQDRR